MEELIAIALFYSYIVNGQRVLPDYEIGCFIDDVKEALRNLRSEYEIGTSRASVYFHSIPCEIWVSNENETQILSAMQEKLCPFRDICIPEPINYYSLGKIEQDFLDWFQFLNQDLVSATLSAKALEKLDIKREDLPIISKVDFRSGETSIYSLKEKEARKSALRGLELDGFKDISIGRGIPTQPDDKAYRFSFTGKKEVYSLDACDDDIFEKIANLKTTLDMEAYKKEALSRIDEDGKLNLDNLWLAKTVLLDKDNNVVSNGYCSVLKLTGDVEAFYNRKVANMLTGTSDVTVFIDLLGDEIMAFISQGKFGNKNLETVVENIMPLSKSMNMECANLEEIKEHIDGLNKKNVKKELIPENK